MLAYFKTHLMALGFQKITYQIAVVVIVYATNNKYFLSASLWQDYVKGFSMFNISYIIEILLKFRSKNIH